jgi:glutathione S-transferase
MLTLFYSPGACSQAPHIVLHETGIAHDAVRVDLKTKTTDDGGSYLDINPKGAVPAIRLESGDVLTENAVILQFLGDRAGDVLPPVGDFRRYRVLEWTNFITTELHKSFSPLFKPDASDETKGFFRDILRQRLGYVNAQLDDRAFLAADHFTIADAYLFVMLGWAEKMIGLDAWPNLAAFRARMMERPSVRNVLRFEGLLEDEAAD